MYLLLFLAVAAVSQPNVKAGAKPVSVAMVLEVKGDVQRKTSDGKTKPLSVLDRLYPGDVLTAAAEAGALIVVFDDDHRERLKPEGKANVRRDGLEPAAARETIASPGKASLVASEELKLRSEGRGAVFELRSVDPKPADESPQRVSPMANTAEISTRPTFRWPEAPRAKRYLFELYADGSNRLIHRQFTDQRELKLPADVADLKPGRSFHWTLTPDGVDGAKSIPSAFSVLSKEEADRLASAIELAKSSDVADWLLAASAFEDCGAYEPALQLFEKLAKAQPKQPVFQIRLAHYYALAGRTDDAEQASRTAKALSTAAEKR